MKLSAHGHRVETERPRPLLPAAVERLYIQLQVVGGAVAETADAAVLNNVTRLSGHHTQRVSHVQSRAGARPEGRACGERPGQYAALMHSLNPADSSTFQ